MDYLNPRLITNKRHKEREAKMAAKPYPFKETPILYGDEALRFQREIEHPVRVSEEERQAQMEAYDYIKSIATFPLP